MTPRSALIAAFLSAGASAQPLQALGTAPTSQSSGARVRARLVGPDGQPIEGLRLWIAGLGPIADEAVCGQLRRAYQATDADGWIDRWVPGPGTYTLLAEPCVGPWPAWMLPPVDVSTVGARRLQARYARLRIRAVDRLGGPVEDGDSFCVRPGGEVWNWESPDIGESGTATLEPDAVLIHGATRPWRASDPHTWIVRPGCSYVCGWFSPSRGLVERRVDLAWDVWEREVTFVLGDPAPTSRLVVEVAAGTLGEASLPVGVAVESPTCGAALVRVEVQPLHKGGRDFRLDLPAGRYWLCIAPAASRHDMGMDEPGGASMQLPIALGLGDELRRMVQLARGSRLTLELRAPAGSLDPRVAELVSLESGFTYLAAVSGWLPSELWGRVWIRPQDQPRERRLWFGLVGTSKPFAGLLPGGSARSFERLAPGRHVLRVECSGFEPAELEIEAVDGEDLAARVDLVPVRR